MERYGHWQRILLATITCGLLVAVWLSPVSFGQQLYTTEFIDVGRIYGDYDQSVANFKAVVVSLTGGRQYFLRISMPRTQPYKADYYVTLLPADELLSLSGAVNVLIEKAVASKSLTPDWLNTVWEAKEGKLQAGYMQYGDTQTAYLSIGTADDAMVTLKVSRLPELKNLVDKTISMLEKLEAKIGAPPVSLQVPTVTGWHTVATWAGNGLKTTEGFDITGRDWRISWEATGTESTGLLQVYVYSEGGKLVTVAANQQGPGLDASYVRAGPGRYSLTIQGLHLGWRVWVEEEG